MVRSGLPVSLAALLGPGWIVFVGVFVGEFAVGAAACFGVPGTAVIVLCVGGIGSLACLIGFLTGGEVLLVCPLGATRFPDDPAVTLRTQLGGLADEAACFAVRPPETAGDLGDRFAFDAVEAREVSQVDAGRVLWWWVSF